MMTLLRRCNMSSVWSDTKGGGISEIFEQYHIRFAKKSKRPDGTIRRQEEKQVFFLHVS